jgi:hypothetical protein
MPLLPPVHPAADGRHALENQPVGEGKAADGGTQHLGLLGEHGVLGE